LIYKKIILTIVICVTFAFGAIEDKNSNDVYSISETLKNKIIHLAGEKKINTRYMKISKQTNKYRKNHSLGEVNIPKEKSITPDTVYNTLRVINATLIDINTHFGVDSTVKTIKVNTKKTPSEVYDVVYKSYETLKTLLKDKSYEN